MASECCCRNVSSEEGVHSALRHRGLCAKLQYKAMCTDTLPTDVHAKHPRSTQSVHRCICCPGAACCASVSALHSRLQRLWHDAESVCRAADAEPCAWQASSFCTTMHACQRSCQTQHCCFPTDGLEQTQLPVPVHLQAACSQSC